MTKPHEEEWTTGEGALSGALYSGETWIGSFTDTKRARLAVQAPAMAKALLSVGRQYDNGWHLFGCVGGDTSQTCDAQCTDSRTALKAAGVIP